MSRYFYDDTENQRIAQVHADPAQATMLRSGTDVDSALASPLAHAASVPAGARANLLAAPAARGASARGANRSAVLNDSEAMHRVREAQEEKLTMALKHVFELYNRWEGGVNRSRMNKTRFQKVFRCAFVDALCGAAGLLIAAACARHFSESQKCTASAACCLLSHRARAHMGGERMCLTLGL